MIDSSVEPSKYFHGGQDEGKRRLKLFMEGRLAEYAQQRNHPEAEGTSELSAYLHFGQISVQQIAWDIHHYRNYGLESPRLLKRGMKSRSLFGAWGWVGLAHFSVIRGVVAQDIFGRSHC
jgi:hypothetical protein